MAKFIIPKTVKHEETKVLLKEITNKLKKDGNLNVSDFPQLHRMATAYDAYLDCVDVLSNEGSTMKNNKGEIVKRPEANLLKENWAQYLELAKEYGMTVKSRSKIKVMDAAKEEESPFEAFLRETR